MTSVVISNVHNAAASRLQLAASRLQLTASPVCAVCAQLTTTLKINIANKFCENMLHELTLSVNEVFFLLSWQHFAKLCLFSIS